MPLSEELRQRVANVVDEQLGWDFDEDTLAQWRICSDALASALLDHPVFKDDETRYVDLAEVVAVLVAKEILTEDVTDLIRDLDQASETSQYGCYSDETLSDANACREELHHVLAQCFAPKDEQDDRTG